MAFPRSIADRLALPLIAAPMLRVSGPDLVIAACRSGVIGAFPTANQPLGCDLAYMGTRFIATTESMAAPDYKRMLVQTTAQQYRAAMQASVALATRMQGNI